jgi:murein DD-endopeptidase MepM/ murein hydrolase activator NlpD
MKLGRLLSGPQRLRGLDTWGSGAFDAPRGERRHRGIDIVIEPGETVLCPLDGNIVRVAEPYDDEPRFNGLLLSGSGSYSDLELKLFYLDDFALGPIKTGAVMAMAQDIALRYPGITPHIHVELRVNGDLQNPTDYFELEDAFF